MKTKEAYLDSQPLAPATPPPIDSPNLGSGYGDDDSPSMSWMEFIMYRFTRVL